MLVITCCMIDNLKRGRGIDLTCWVFEGSLLEGSVQAETSDVLAGRAVDVRPGECRHRKFGVECDDLLLAILVATAPIWSADRGILRTPIQAKQF